MRCNYYHGACELIAPIDSPHWLRAPSKLVHEDWLIRCPFHWNEWALRSTIGKSRSSFALMAVADQWAMDHPWMKHPLVHPDTTCEDEKYLRDWKKTWR